MTFRPTKRRKSANVHFNCDAEIWERAKVAAAAAGLSQGRFAEEALRFALDNMSAAAQAQAPAPLAGTGQPRPGMAFIDGHWVRRQ